MRVWTWTVSQASARADLALLHALSEGGGNWDDPQAGSAAAPSRSQIRRWIDSGWVSCDGAPLKASAKLAPGAKIVVRVPAPEPLELVPEDRPLEILHEDRHLLVLNKPPGLTVHPSETRKQGTLVHALLFHVKDLSGIGGKLRPGIVHRLDKDTSGALVISKTDEAHRALTETFSKHEIERAYWALCYGAPARREGTPEVTIDTRIARNPADRKKMANVTTNAKTGRRAVSRYRVRETFQKKGPAPFASWLEVRLETGRTHQVRVHLTGLGCSLLGDPVYGVPTERQAKWLALPEDVREAVRALPGQALHARVLGFRHPVTGEHLRFEAEPPPRFRALLETLERYTKERR